MEARSEERLVVAASSRNRRIRAPQQKRSIDKKEKIVEAAYAVFCSKGFYKTTTVDIARAAGVSIGTLYAYFTDKDDLFMAIFERYMESFDKGREKMFRSANEEGRSYREIVRSIFVTLLEEHEASKELNREIDQLAYVNPVIAARLERQHAKIRQAIADYLHAHRDDLRVTDVESAAMVVWQLTDSLVHCIVFEAPPSDRDRLLDAGVDALCAYLVK